MLNLEQKIFIVQTYGSGNSISLKYVLHIFREKYPQVEVTISTARRLIKLFQATGSVEKKRKQKKCYDENDAATIVALDSIAENPRLSLRARSTVLNISKSELQRIYDANNIKAFKPRYLHTLEEGDEAYRLYFCACLGEKILENRDFHRKIIFSDESTFTTNGTVSSQNCRFWAKETPDFVIHGKRQYFQKVNVWCAVSYDLGIIGPYFIETVLNQVSYLQILERFFGEYLEHLPIDQRRTLYYQHDGCPAHSTARVTEWLNATFPNQWIGRNGPIKWPPRSPDITVSDFYLWGRLKQIVYSEPLPNDRELLKQRIKDACNTVTIEEIRSCYEKFREKIEKCFENGGSYIE